MFAYGAGPCARGRPGHRARQHLHGHRQAAAQGRGRHRLRGRPDRDRDPGRRHRRRRRTSPPTCSARPSTTRSPPRCWSPPSERLADEVEAELDKQVLGHQARRADPHRARRAAVRHRAGRRPRAGPRRRQRLRRRAPRDPDRATPPPCAARVRNAGAIFVGPHAPVSPRRLLRRLQPRAAHRRLRLPLLGAVGARVHQVGARRRLLRARRCAEVADHVVTLAEAEDLPGHGAAVRVRFDGR